MRTAFADSLALDEALRVSHGRENRWGLSARPHGQRKGHRFRTPLSEGGIEISTVIKKKDKAKEQLQSHLRPGARVAAWLWVASEKVHFANTERARLRLDQNGIVFVGSKVMRKHLPDGSPGST